MARSFAVLMALTAALSGVTTPAWSQTGAPLPNTALPSPASAPVVPDDYRLDTDDTVLVDVALHTDISR